MRKTYKFRLHPSKEQEVLLDSWLYRCRKLYNVCLEQRKLAHKSYGKSLSAYDQMSQLPELKAGFPEYKEINSQVLQNVVKRVDETYQDFYKRVKRGDIQKIIKNRNKNGKKSKKSKMPGFPRFKSRYRYNSFTYPQAPSVFSITNGHLKMSKLGIFKVIQHREIPKHGLIKTLTIKRDNCGDWWASFSVDMGDAPAKAPINNTVGIDLNIGKLVVMSNGQFFENKRFIMQQGNKLKLLDRRLSRKKKGSNNRTKARLKRARVYRTIQNKRHDYLHKISRYLVENYDLLAFEDLQILNMMKNHHAARSIENSSWGKLTQFTAFKAEEAGKTVVLVNPRNTTQECSQCGEIVWKSLSVRTHACPVCGFISDRDHNASLNIEHRALKQIGWEPPELTPVEIGVQSEDLINISPWLSQSMNQEAISSTACG